MRLLGLALLALLGCDAALDIPDRVVGAHVACQAGSCACAAGFADCDADRGDGCETSLLDDADHCGACGHGCGGGACREGACQPIRLGGARLPNSIAVHGDDVFWGDFNGHVWRSGTPSPIANAKANGIVKGLVIDGGELAWMSQDDDKHFSLVAAPLAGGPPSTRAGGIGATGIGGLAAVGGRAYFTADFDTPAPALDTVPIAGGKVETIATGDPGDFDLLAVAVTASGRRVASIADYTVFVFDSDSGARTELAAKSNANAVAADGEAFVVGLDAGLFRAEPGGALERWVDDTSYVFRVASYEGAVAWAQVFGGEIHLREPDGTVRVVASGLPAIDAIALDATWIAWATDTEVQKVAR